MAGIDRDQLEIIHAKYKELESLSKTAKWAEKELGVQCTRHTLSKAFHKAGMWVAPPNGRPEQFRPRQYFYDATNKLVAAFLSSVWDDLRTYKETGDSRTNFLSACAHLASDQYPVFLSALLRGSTIKVSPDLLPPWMEGHWEGYVGGHTLPADIIAYGNETYATLYRAWVGGR